MMRILNTILLLTLTSVLKASCLAGFARVSFPSPGAIAGNSIFVINYDQFSNLDNTIDRGYRMYLYSDNGDTVNLGLKTRYTINWDFHQVVLRPVNELKLGHTYTMHIDSLYGFSSEINGSEIKWKVTAASDLQFPRWLKQPNYLGNSVERYGCGPEKNAYFCYCAEDNFQHAVVVRRKAPGSIMIEECIEVPWNGMLAIGHGMCGGPFRYTDSTYCDISFRLIDGSGNMSADSSIGIRFPSPNYNDSSAEFSCNCGQVENSDKKNFGIYLPIFALVIALVAGLSWYAVAGK